MSSLQKPNRITTLQELRSEKVYLKQQVQESGEKLETALNVLKFTLPLSAIFSFLGNKLVGGTFSYLPIVNKLFSFATDRFKFWKRSK